MAATRLGRLDYALVAGMARSYDSINQARLPLNGRAEIKTRLRLQRGMACSTTSSSAQARQAACWPTA